MKKGIIRGLALSLAVLVASAAAPATQPAAHTTPVAAVARSGCPSGFAADRIGGGLATSQFCQRLGGPEPMAEGLAAEAYANLRENGLNLPANSGALSAGVAHTAAVNASAASIPGAGAGWNPVGTTPLHNDSTDPAYNLTAPQTTVGSLNALGYPEMSGRLNDFAYDPSRSGRYFAATAGGGAWESVDAGTSWRSISSNLAAGALGAIVFTPANAGTIVVGSGDPATGRYSQGGIGAFWSVDDGSTWHQSTGYPDSSLTFRMMVDPSNPSTIYAGTSRGLYRSADTGASWFRVTLPTTCASPTDNQCYFANFVTDVAVRPTPAVIARGARAAQATPTVMAAVGWKFGQLTMPGNASIAQAPQNGIYVGDGQTMTYVASGANGFPAVDKVGRVSLSYASGAGQDHNVVYAIVQDALKLQGCADAAEVDVKTVCNSNVPTATSTFLEGAYVSRDFGATWTRIMDPVLLKTPASNSAIGFPPYPGYGPGIQSWYNIWIRPDPTVQDGSGVPTRVLFGLEEIWENNPPIEGAPTGVTGLTAWHAIGRYWNACSVLIAGPVLCNTSPYNTIVPGTTTHPDQHAALFIPENGGVTLLAGSDGGAYKQHVAAGGDFSNDSWGKGINHGISSLQAYDADIAQDGTVTAGLQDNGNMKINGRTGRADMIFGGDGFQTGIDPENSLNIAEEYVGGVVSVTQDGGVNWCTIDPGFGSNAQFNAPLQRDPFDAKHYIVAGDSIQENTDTYSQSPCAEDTNLTNPWTNVFALGTAPGGNPHVASAVDVSGANVYAGFCGYCTTVVGRFAGAPFENGIATNVGGSAPPQKLKSDGWHFAKAAGLPQRFITSIRMEPAHPRTVYVTLGGYSVPWYPPGATLESISKIGTGHVYKSTDAGETFTDITGDLPDVPTNFSAVHDGQLVVANELGVFISSGTSGGHYGVLGAGLPGVRVYSLRFKPGDPDYMIAATFGRGVWSYIFPPSVTPVTGDTGPSMLPQTGTAGPLGVLVLGALALAAVALTRRARRRIL